MSVGEQEPLCRQTHVDDRLWSCHAQRGSRQAAVIVISALPDNRTFQPVLEWAVDEYLRALVAHPEQHAAIGPAVLAELYTGLTSTLGISHQLQLVSPSGVRLVRVCIWLSGAVCCYTQWGHTLELQHSSDVERWSGASLTRLVTTFREDTMLLWYGLLLGKRIVFVGQPALEACNCCAAAPFLVAPLTGFQAQTRPYVPLTNLAEFLALGR